MAFPLDRRTRRNDEIGEVAPAAFFADRFPEFAARNGHLVAEAIAQLAAPPLAVEVGDASWTVTTDQGSVVARPGVTEGSVVVTMTAEQFSDWAQDVRSFNALVVARELQCRNGGEHEISVWDSLWRCLLDGWPVVGDLTFVDRHGRPLDLDAVFTPDDDPADVAHFLREAGFLHLRGWLEPEQTAALSVEIDAALPCYSQGDGRSWWARLEDGSIQCVRMQEFVDHSPTTAALVQSARWAQLRETLGAEDQLEFGRPGNKVFEALVKPVGVVAGASNLPFHRDCHFGGHARGCSGVDVGITVTASGPDNGHLSVVAGSHRIAIPVSIANTTPYLPVVDVATEAGDLTVHLSCTLHASREPLIATRKVMYGPFKLAPREDDVPRPVERAGSLRERVHTLLLEPAATASS